MATKRKKILQTDTNPVKTDEGRVSQVVEVVGETDKEEALETIKKDAAEIETMAEELEQAPPESTASVPEESYIEEEKVAPQLEETETEKHKEVVEELFQKDPAEIPVEITTVKNGSGKKLFIWAAIVVGVAILVGGALITLSGGAVPFTARPTPTPTPAPTPTPIQTASLDRKDLTIRVLNGGGVAGAAGKMKAFLEEKGYTVSAVGNTDEYTFEQTEIAVKKDKEAFITLLEEDLKGEYTIGSAAATLDENSSYDAVITAGKE